MKKLLLFISLLFLISGCTSEYNLYISDNEIKENIHIEYLQNDDIQQINDEYYVFHDNDEVRYEKNITKNGNINILDLTYIYKPDEYVNADSFNYCFNKKNVINDKDFLKIELSKYSGCVEDNSFDIKIKTNNKVLENNADIVKDNTYIWHVDNQNAKEFSLNFKIAKGILENNPKSEFLYLFIIGSIIITIILLFTFKYKKRLKLINR